MTTVMDRIESSGAYVFPDIDGVSDDATISTYYTLWTEMLVKIRQSESRSRIIDHAVSTFAKALQEGVQENWDGYGAKRINIDSWYRAINFARLLSPEIPMPDIYMDTNGEATFEWYMSARRVFSVTVSGENELVYAGLFGSNKSHGVEKENKDELPRAIIDLIHRAHGE